MAAEPEVASGAASAPNDELRRAVRETLGTLPPFVQRVEPAYRETLDALDVLQVNVGFRCNLACKHCHVEGGPHRTEVMSRETMQHCLDVFCAYGFKTLDVTGGAPEMNPHFEWFIREAHARGARTIVRSNLVILHEEPYKHLPEVYAELGVNVVASLPHYVKKSMEKQRGSDTFDPVISMLQRLNELGYGKGGGLQLDLVFNPAGALLPPDQAALEREYKAKLAEDFGIVFDNLFAFTNAPGGRFAQLLQKRGILGKYMNKLIDAFNPDTVPSMMCRSELSVGWDGTLYDCDFNLAEGISCASGLTIADMARAGGGSPKREIRFGNHCYACTAGAGSS